MFVLKANVHVCLREEVSTSQLLTKGMTDIVQLSYTPIRLKIMTTCLYAVKTPLTQWGVDTGPLGMPCCTGMVAVNSVDPVGCRVGPT